MPIVWLGTNQTASTGAWIVPVASTTCTSATAQLYQATAYQAMASQTAASTAYWYSEQETCVDHQLYLALAQNRAAAYRVRTEAARIELEQQQQLAQERAARRAEETKAANARSRELLLAHLTAAQRETFERRKWFIVEGGTTKQTYRIRTETYAGNIDVLSGDRVKHRLCVHCPSNIPLHDHHLAQKLSLQYDEEYLLSIANRQAA
jgi:hypothetical protein